MPTARPLAVRDRLDQRREPREPGAVGIAKTWPQGEPAEEHRLGLAARRVAVQLADHDAAVDAPVDEERVGARDPVPRRRARVPEEALDRRQTEPVEERRLGGDEATERIERGGDVLGGAGERVGGAGVEQHRLLVEARRAVEPGVREHAGRDHALGEFRVRAHASLVQASAVAR